MIQDEIFLASEGDQWFERNRETITEVERKDPISEMVRSYRLQPKTILEVGASNGWRLSRLATLLHAKCIGIDPSAKAVADGTKRYKNITLRRGVASSIPVRTSFDLVIVNFVFHWISRESLLSSVAEIDRVVKPGGQLIIGDFLPDVPRKVHYHHLPRGAVTTYKQDYAAVFLASNLYQMESRLIFDHEGGMSRIGIQESDRSSVTLLTKQPVYLAT